MASRTRAANKLEPALGHLEAMQAASPSPELSNSSSSPLSFGSSNSISSTDANGNATYTRKSAKMLHINNNNNNFNTTNQSSKSPILIKYNYYDNSGVKMEQTSQEMMFAGQQQASHKLQRQLSPTFKQTLDQIVRSQVEQSRGSPLEPNLQPHMEVARHQDQEQTQTARQVQLARRYKMCWYEQRCLRCKKTVYQMDKVGPLKDFTFYHAGCFKCRQCGTKLTLKTYFNNQQWSADKEVYCHRHCPKTPAGKLDKHSVGIRAALNAPKVFEAVMGQGGEHLQMLHSPQQAGCEQMPVGVDGQALYIQHAVQQTRLQNIYKQSGVDKKISELISNRLEFLEPKQKMLEMRHRQEEDALFKAFELKWRQEESSISDQIRQEWQRELAKLLDKYKRQLSEMATSVDRLPNRVGASQSAASKVGSPQPLVQQAVQSNAGQQQQQQQQLGQSSCNGQNKQPQQAVELERLNLEKTMTIKLDRKKETLKRKLKEFERQATAELVEKQSREMLALISIKLDEYKEEQQRKIDLDQLEALESLSGRLDASLRIHHDPSTLPTNQMNRLPLLLEPARELPFKRCPGGALDKQATLLEAPAPKPPQTSKWELYNSDEPDELFRDIDQRAINVAREDQQTFTDLVHHLTRDCLTDIEKARAIFRWITVKNLNTMHFDSSVQPDTPLGLLRGIKNGSESYHVLFKRLCSYAGLHCAVIKGYSKSAGYQPGVKFEGSRFRNSWNAVFVAGAWRFVQCNWGARHLVSVAVMQDKHDNGNNKNGVSPNGKSDRSPIPIRSDSQQVSGGNGAALHHHHQHHQHQLKKSDNNNDLRHDQPTANMISALPRVSPISPRSSNSRATPSKSPVSSSSSSSSSAYSTASSPSHRTSNNRQQTNNQSMLSSPNNNNSSSNYAKQLAPNNLTAAATTGSCPNDSLRYEYDDHYFLTDPDEFIYEFFPLSSEWQLIKSRPITLAEFEQLPFVRSLFFKYGLYFPQPDIKSVLYTDSSGATTIKIGMPTHMIPSLIFHYNLKYFESDLEHFEGTNLKRFVMQSVESGDGSSGQIMLSNIVSFRVHLPENGAYILDIFANSTTPTQYITGEPMKFKSVCKFKIIAKNLKTVMIPLPDCASGEYGPIKATRLFGIIPITHESGLICVQNDKRFLEIQFRMTRPLLDFMASLHKNGYDERQLSKAVKIFIDGNIVIITAKFFEDGQYGLDIYTRDQSIQAASKNRLDHSLSPIHDGSVNPALVSTNNPAPGKKQLLTHCCKYLINVRTTQVSR